MEIRIQFLFKMLFNLYIFDNDYETNAIQL